MTNATGLREAAEALKGHAWLERFRKASYQNKYHELSPSCANQISGYVDDFLNKVLAAHPASEEPITEAKCRELGFYSDWGSLRLDFDDGQVDFDKETGRIGIAHRTDVMDVSHIKTMTQLLHLLAALECGVQQTTNSGKAGE